MILDCCENCQLRPSLCHGVADHCGVAGCVSLDHRKCAEQGWTCVCNPGLLAERLREAGGFGCELRATLRPTPVPLPRYIPTIYNNFPRTKPLEIEWVAVPLHVLFSYSSGVGLEAIAQTGQRLRQSLGVQDDARIVITGPGPDQMLEYFWRFHRKGSLLKLMRELAIQLFTVPNFSFLLDAPPLQHRYNRSRILRIAERASDAGLNPVLHLNALHEADWRDWEHLLSAHPEITTLCLEFQTGYSSPLLGRAAFARLVELQDRIKRPIHPILIGGARYAEALGKSFKSCTLIDAQPFMHTFHRKICRVRPDGQVAWAFQTSALGENLGGRFTANLRTYSQRLNERLRGVPASRQTEFHFRLPSYKRLQPRCKQFPVMGLDLFAQSQKQSEQVPVPKLLSHSEPPIRRPVERQVPVARGQAPSRVESSTSPPNLYRKSNRYKPRPNEFGSRNTTDAVDGH